jgi:hypothetical protein
MEHFDKEYCLEIWGNSLTYLLIILSISIERRALNLGRRWTTDEEGKHL